MSIRMTRRTALMAAAAAPLAAATEGRAAAHGGGQPAMGRARGFTLGEMTVSTLLAGTAPRENPQSIFGTNVSAEEFAAAAEANFLPTDRAQFFFTPTVVQTGGAVILFDTGLNAAGTTAALAETGLGPDDITHVVLTHMHGDHIGGLSDESGAPTFANAAYVTGRIEFDHWAGAGNDGFEAKVRPLAERMSFVEDGASIAPGVTAMLAAGHTPGHMTWRLESNGQTLLLMADLANHYVFSLAYPDWEVRFDADKAAAAAARRRVLGMLAAERMPVIGYHMPFPGLGYVETAGDGFRYVPHSYQLMG